VKKGKGTVPGPGIATAKKKETRIKKRGQFCPCPWCPGLKKEGGGEKNGCRKDPKKNNGTVPGWGVRETYMPKEKKSGG